MTDRLFTLKDIANARAIGYIMGQAPPEAFLQPPPTTPDESAQLCKLLEQAGPYMDARASLTQGPLYLCGDEGVKRVDVKSTLPLRLYGVEYAGVELTCENRRWCEYARRR